MPHLPGTYLDGAAMRRPADGAPVIALTLRHDRIDNFWFTLLHEFCHVARHLGAESSLIVDDLEVASRAKLELEADAFAQEALVPKGTWKLADNPELTSEEVTDVASRAGVHPSIVAGRWQRTYSDYRRFSKLIIRGEVRSLLNFESD
jgi:HTH-type transcriptional regulator/antitoxin HigA